MRKLYSVLVLGLLLSFNFIKAQSNVLSAEPEFVPDLYIDKPEGFKSIEGPLTKDQTLLYANKVMSCPTSNTLVSGYPAWANYWAGWMVNINNVSTNTINIECFEARFQGTSGYRIYTKTGTFVGFETTAGAWTLVGTAANVTSISTTTSTPIPIAVNQTINPGTTRAFYLTRTDNVVANRHLYVAGAGTPGTTVYANDANIQITEANYIDVYFINMGGTRRPSFQVYYSIFNPLPIELKSFSCTNKKIGLELNWSTATETKNDYFAIERSLDGKNFEQIARVEGAGNSASEKTYKHLDKNPPNGSVYYRLKQVDFSGESTYSDLTTCSYERVKTKINVYSYTGVFLASAETEDYASAIEQLQLTGGIYIIEFTGNDPVFLKHIQN